MKRRLLAILLALLLAVMLCELHVCSGDDCLICAQTAPVRRLCACFAVCAGFIHLRFFLRTDASDVSALPVFIHFTPVDLKVRMTD